MYVIYFVENISIHKSSTKNQITILKYSSHNLKVPNNVRTNLTILSKMSSKQKKYENQPDNMEDSEENDSGEDDSDEDGSNPDIYKGNEVIFDYIFVVYWMF